MLPSRHVARRVSAIDTLAGPARRGVRADVGDAAARRRDRHHPRRPDLQAPTTPRRCRASSRRTSAGWPTRLRSPAARYAIKHADARGARRRRRGSLDRIDVHTLDRDESGAPKLALNDIGRVAPAHVASAGVRPTMAAAARTGAFILIDEATNDTVGAGMIRA